MEEDFEVLVWFTRKGEGAGSELEIRLDYKDEYRLVIEGQLYFSIVADGEYSKIMEFDEIIQKLNLWYIYSISSQKNNYLFNMGCKMNTSQLNKEQLIENYFKLFQGGIL